MVDNETFEIIDKIDIMEVNFDRCNFHNIDQNTLNLSKYSYNVLKNEKKFPKKFYKK